jgi:DNA (cytosine-5)-methyltransferase 1
MPKLLDLFRGEGGAAEGYERAGWDVTGVDNKPLGHRGPGRFIQGDALAYLAVHWHEYDAYHASPPCQGYTIATAGNPAARAKHRRLIAATRELLILTGRPWVIENVEQARRQMVDPIMLCGRMFGLGALDEDGEPLTLDRHRLFESNITLTAPEHPKHNGEQVAGVYGGSRRAKRRDGETLAEVAPRDRYAARVERGGGYVPRSVRVQQALLGIDWMTVKGMQESIPPVYAEYVGRQLIEAL